MILIIKNQIGRVHHACGYSHLQKTRPVYCFVPEQFFDSDGIDKRRYLMSRWPSINCESNIFAIGSHVFPDPEAPVTIRSRCPILREFLTSLEQVISVRSLTVA